MSVQQIECAVELRDRIAAGAVKAADVAKAAIERIEALEDSVRAFAWFDPAFVLTQAAELDRYRKTGRDLGPLHGVPVAIKDIIDTAKIPTENGSAVDAGRVPSRDAFVVARLKQAGALIMGKTVTTELAFMDPGVTRNPHNPDHTPGGSSSGSAAAVAAGMVPLAIGTQTAGSVIRPASFCGAFGFKPSFGMIPRTGILTQAPSLDTVGVFANSVAGAALLAETLAGYDEKDLATGTMPVPHLLAGAQSLPPVEPAIALVKPPGWENADKVMQDGFDELAGFLGENCIEVALPPHFDQHMQLRETVQLAELAKSYYRYSEQEKAIGPKVLQAIRSGAKIPVRDYLAARDWPAIYNAALEEILDRFDFILTPAAPGPAPKGLSDTGNPVFNGLWTFCGVPCITLPLMATPEGLPMGVQLVMRRGEDGRLLRNAAWLTRLVRSAQADG